MLIIDKTKEIQLRKTLLFDNAIYNNFIELSKYPKLMHNSVYDVTKLLNSPNLLLICAYDEINNCVAGYAVCEKKIINNERVLFINYIYVAKNYRKKGVGTLLVNYVEKKGNLLNFNNLMLICNYTDEVAYNWYSTMNFYSDTQNYDIIHENYVVMKKILTS